MTDDALRVFSPDTIDAVTRPKPVAVRAKRAARRSALEALSTLASDIRAGAWFLRDTPPSLAEVWRDRIVPWHAMPAERHRCEHVPDGDLARRFTVDGGLSCACSNVTDEDRRGGSKNIRIMTALRWGWIAWNHLVAVPLTAVLYALAWMHQRPGRAFLGWSLGGIYWAVVSSA